MNMKKVFAGALASVVAVSAMATIVSADNAISYTKDQAAKSKTWDLAAKVYPVKWTGEAGVAMTDVTVTPGTGAIGSVLTFSNTNATAYTFTLSEDTGIAGDAEATVTGTAIAIKVKDLSSVTPAMVQTAVAAKITGITCGGTGTITAGNGNITGATSTNTKKPIDVTIVGESGLEVKLPATVILDTLSIKVTGYKGDSNGIASTDLTTTTIPLTPVYKDPKNPDKKEIVSWVVTQVAPNTATSAGKIDLSNYVKMTDLTFSYTMVDRTKKSKSDADDLALKPRDVLFTVSKTGVGSSTVFDKCATAFNRNISTSTGTVQDVESDHGPKMGDLSEDDKGTLYYLNQADGSVSNEYKIVDPTDSSKKLTVKTDNKYIADLKTAKFGNLFKAIQTEIGDAKGATITFNLYSDDNGSAPKYEIAGGTVAGLTNADSQNFAIALNYTASTKFTAGQAVKTSADKIVFNWDDLTKGLAAGQIFNSAIRVNVDDDEYFQIDSVTVDVPAMALKDLSAGEAATQTSKALTTAAAATTKAAATEATTKKATNPKTGNAPIALAVIPVAVVAAAVIAKKRG